jgi:hypothetical protein
LGAASARAILHGDMPYWNHYEGVGAPLAGEMQNAAFLPTTLLLVLPNGLLLSHILLEIVAGFFTYLFLRRLGLLGKVALIGGVMFALNGTFAWLTNAAFNPIAFLPMMMYGAECIISNGIKRLDKNKDRGWLWLPAGIALSLYAGFPETAFINALLVAAWLAIGLWRIKIPKPEYVKKIVLAGTAGIALAAPILVAFLGYLKYADIGGHTEAFSHAALDVAGIPMHIFPYIYGPIAALSQYDTTNTLGPLWGSVGGYIGITTFFFAVVGLFSRIDNKLKLVLIGWIAACLLKTFGVNVIEDIWNLIPSIKNAAFFRYATPSIYFAMTVLAAYGIQELVRYTLGWKRLIRACLVSAAILLVALLIAKGQLLHMAGAPHYKHFAAVSVLWGLGLLAMIVVGLIIVKRKYIYPFLFFCIVADVLLMFTIPQLSTPKVTIDKSPVHFFQQNLGLNRFYTLGPVAPNYGSYFQIASINQNDLPTPRAWDEYLTDKLDINTDPVLFIGSYRRDASGPTAFEEFLRNERNYEYVSVKYLVTGHKQLTSSEVAAANLSLQFSSTNSDIYKLPNVQPYYEATGDCQVADTNSRDVVKVSCIGAGGIIRKELYMPGWQVNVDGKTTDVQQSNDVFQTIPLSEGSHELKFTYSPPHISLAWLVFSLGAVATAYWLFPEKFHSIMDRVKNQATKHRRKS